MRQTLQTLIVLLGQGNQTHAPFANSAWTASEHNLMDYENDIVYALGRLRAFGVLTNLGMIDELRDRWVAQLIMGSIHGTISSQDLLPRLQNPLILATLEQQLEHVFGLRQVEANRVANAYLQTMTGWLVVNLSIAERSVS